MRAGLLLILFSAWAAAACAGPWGLELSLLGGMGVASFAGDPKTPPPPPNSLFALFPPDETKNSQGFGLAGSAGLAFNFTRKRRYYVDLELLTSGQMLKFEEEFTFSGGTKLRRSTVWDWSSFRPTFILAYAHPMQMGVGWALAPRLGGGLWYEKVGSRRKLIGADGAEPQEFNWKGAPEDDWGWIAVLGLDWLRLGKGSGPARIGLDLRWREGRALPEPAAGADKPVRVIDAVLTVPVYLWAF